jgi:hypothetical protein
MGGRMCNGRIKLPTGIDGSGTAVGNSKHTRLPMPNPLQAIRNAVYAYNQWYMGYGGNCRPLTHVDRRVVDATVNQPKTETSKDMILLLNEY